VPDKGTKTELTSGPAGSVFITDYPILHRRAAATVACIGINPIVTLDKQLLNMIGNLVQSGRAALQGDNRI
jgi:hypothetical protein